MSFFKTEQSLTFHHQFLALMASGFSPHQAAELFKKQYDRKKTKEEEAFIAYLIESTSKGEPLFQAWSQFNAPSWMVCLIKMGETSGKLETCIEEVINFQEFYLSIYKKIKSALMYPIILCCFLFVFLLFKFGFGVFIQGLIAGGLVMLAIKLFQNTEKIPFILKVPHVGNILHLQQLALFLRMFSALYKAGIPVPQILEQNKNALFFNSHKKQVDMMAKSSRSGNSFIPTAKSFQNPFILDTAVYFLQTGEETGNYDDMCLQAANYYIEDLDLKISQLMAFLKTFSIVAVGIAFGFNIIKSYIPIFNLANF